MRRMRLTIRRRLARTLSRCDQSTVMFLRKKIAHELTENLRQNLTVDWSERESVRAKLRLMVKRVLRKYKYPPDLQEEAVDLVLRQAQVFGESWRDT